MSFGSWADYFDNQVWEADAIELFREVAMGRIILSRKPLISVVPYWLILEEEVDIFQACDDPVCLVGGEDGTLQVKNRIVITELSEYEDRAGQSAYHQLYYLLT